MKTIGDHRGSSSICILSKETRLEEFYALILF